MLLRNAVYASPHITLERLPLPSPTLLQLLSGRCHVVSRLACLACRRNVRTFPSNLCRSSACTFLPLARNGFHVPASRAFPCSPLS